MTAARPPAARPEDRYGSRGQPSSTGLRVAVGVLAAVFVGWVLWAAIGAAQPDIGGQVVRFSVVSDEAIDVTVAPTPEAPGRFTCSVQVLDRHKAVVGVAEVRLDGGTDQARTVRIETRERAVAALVGECAG